MEHMEDQEQRGHYGQRVRRRIQGILQRGGTRGGGERPSSWTPYAQAGLIFLAVNLTEVHMLLPDTIDNDRKWDLYNALSECAKVLLCLVALAWAPLRMKPTALLASVWYTTQAQQEFAGMNDGTTETWEYWLVAVMTVAIAIQITRR